MMQKNVKFSAFSQAQTFQDLLKVIEVKAGQFNMKSDFIKNVSPDRADAFLKVLMVVLNQNKYFHLSYDIPFESFILTTLMECITAKMILPESAIDLQSRIQMDNYILEYLIKRFKFQNGLFALASGLGQPYEMNPSLKNRRSRLYTAIRGVAPGLTAGTGYTVDEVREAMVTVFCRWSRGGDLDPAEFDVAGVPLNPPARRPNESIDPLFAAYHVRPEDTFVPVTDKVDNDYDVIWSKVAALQIVRDVFSAHTGDLRYHANGMNKALLNLIDWMSGRFWYEMQGFSIEMNKNLRRLAFIPDSEMITDAEARDLNHLRTVRKSIIAMPGDTMSALFSIAFKDMKMSTPSQDLCLDAWAHIDSFNEFAAHYDLIQGFATRFHLRNPLYQKYHRGWLNIDWAWEKTRNKTAFGSQVMEIFAKYKQIIFPVLANLPAPAFYQDKLAFVMDLWYDKLVKGKWGVIDEYIVRPEAPLLRVVGDPLNRNDPLLMYNHFSIPADYNPVRVNHTDVVRAMARGDLAAVLGNNTIVSGTWQNITAGPAQTEQYLTEIIPYGAELRPISVNMELIWSDIKERYNIRVAERFPVVGSRFSPVDVIPAGEWTFNPWYRNGRIEVLYPFEVKLRVDQSQRV
jgi:hypothetical protein